MVKITEMFKILIKLKFFASLKIFINCVKEKQGQLYPKESIIDK